MTDHGWITLGFRALTPIFGRGYAPEGNVHAAADPLDAVRVPSLIGQLRRTLRMLLRAPGVTEAQVEQAVSAVFGTAQSDDEGGTRSPLAWRLRTVPAVTSAGGQLPGNGDPQMAYLLGQGLCERGTVTRPSVSAGARWTMTLRRRTPGDRSRTALQAALTSLRVLEMTGGLGARSSRGWGAFTVDIGGVHKEFWEQICTECGAWPENAPEVPFSGVRTKLSRELCLSEDGRATAPSGRAFSASEMLLTPHVLSTSALAALNDAGSTLIRYRRPREVEFTITQKNGNRRQRVRWATREWPNSVKPDAGGSSHPASSLALPLAYFEVAEKRTHTVNLYPPGNDADAVRFPSLLVIRPVRMKNNQWSWGSIYFDHSWPEDYQIRVDRSVGADNKVLTSPELHVRAQMRKAWFAGLTARPRGTHPTFSTLPPL